MKKGFVQMFKKTRVFSSKHTCLLYKTSVSFYKNIRMFQNLDSLKIKIPQFLTLC